jgi:glycosyltransferase involved in cell wall biosynthesis
MKIAAVMTLRNEVHIAPVNLAYHHAQGIDEFWIIDNGSEDGTVEVLRVLSQRHGWIRWESDPGLSTRAKW